MAHEFKSKVVTANHLLDGDVVYLTPQGTWSRHLREAELISNEDRAAQLIKLAETRPEIIVGAYLSDAGVDANGAPIPVHFREDFRARGPSNYFHGKQAEV